MSEDYDDYSHQELKQLVRNRGLSQPQRVTKNELVEILLADDDKKKKKKPATQQQTVEDYSDYSYNELRQLVSTRGLSQPQQVTKNELVEILLAEDDKKKTATRRPVGQPASIPYFGGGEVSDGDYLRQKMEREERERREREERERLRLEHERELERLRLERERELERLRLDREREELERRRLQREREELERLRLQREREEMERRRLEREREEERRRLEREREEMERLRLEREREEMERRRLEREREEMERREREDMERLRLERQREDVERLEKDLRNKMQLIDQRRTEPAGELSAKPLFKQTSAGSPGTTLPSIQDVTIDPTKLELQMGDDSNFIGAGSFGKVYRATYLGLTVAVKVVLSGQAEFEREINLIKKLRHPNIVQLLGAVADHSAPLMVMEYMPQNLAKLRKSMVSLDHMTFFNIAKDIALGMNFLHGSTPSIVHYDLKPANVLIDKSGNAKVADFGLSSVASLSAKKSTTMSIKGTLAFAAPECLSKKDAALRGPKSDVYSYGVLLWELYTGKEAWEAAELLDIIIDVRDGGRPPMPSDCPPAITALIQDCWSDDPTKRPSFGEILARLECIAVPEDWQELMTEAGANESEITDNVTRKELIETMTYAAKCIEDKGVCPAPDDLALAIQRLNPVDQPRPAQLPNINRLTVDKRDSIRQALEGALAKRRVYHQSGSLTYSSGETRPSSLGAEARRKAPASASCLLS